MVESHPVVTLFKPQGVPSWRLEEVELPVEGLEALRLADLEGLDQETAAARMGVSRPTFSRIITAARTAVADALVKGRAIRVQGGVFMVGPMPEPGLVPGPGRHRWRGRGGFGRGGRGGGPGRSGQGG